MPLSELLKTAALVTPSDRQMAILDTGFYAFFHFGVNTYTDREWGLGTEDPAIFNPAKLDCDNWVQAVKAAGMKGCVITAKHHDGFCLWPSKYTEHCVKNSPFMGGKGDVVRALSDACKRADMKFGFYLSPWDRNSKLYGTPEYNDYFKNQLTELLTGYGEIFYVWFDGACGEGPNGKKQEYDYDGYIELIRKYQPKAAIFNDHGPDIRWVGNEAGTARYAEWAVVPSELCFHNHDVASVTPILEGSLERIYNTNQDLGSIMNISMSKGLVFCPAEMDMSIRPGWFHHDDQEPHSLERLFDTYVRSAGANTTFHLNVPPNKDGLIDPRDVIRLQELGEKLQSSFGHDLVMSANAVVTREDREGSQALISIKFPQEVSISFVELMEDIRKGQRVETFMVATKNTDGNINTYFQGTTVGYRKICPINTASTQEVYIWIQSARDRVEFSKIAVY